jgi:PTS system glucitol/sorbitol-specific IIA component
MIKYTTTVRAVGEMAAEFAAEGILVFFGPQAPEELHEFAVITDEAPLTSEIKPGDLFDIGDHSYPITSVGEMANGNVAELGHLVVKFNGLEEPELPGDVSVVAVSSPIPAVGETIRISTLEGDS